MEFALAGTVRKVFRRGDGRSQCNDRTIEQESMRLAARRRRAKRKRFLAIFNAVKEAVEQPKNHFWP